MWSRKELKTRAKALLKVNYWKAVIASLVLLFCSGAGIFVGFQATNDPQQENSLVDVLTGMDPEVLLATIAIFLSALAVAYIFSLIVSIFILNPLEVGAQKLLLNCKDGQAEIGNIAFSFKNSYLNAVKTMFLRKLFVKLWAILFVIPGIVKSYEYRMIPYLLAENPQMSSKEAFAKSKEMMRGNKWQAFVLDLSFLGWDILGVITCGIVEVFFSAPYHDLANAELYHELKKQG